MIIIDITNQHVTQMNVLTVAPSDQNQLLTAMRTQVDEVISKQPGFRSSTLHASEDGTRVVNYVQFDTAEQLHAAHSAAEFLAQLENYRKWVLDAGPRLYRIYHAVTAENVR